MDELDWRMSSAAGSLRRELQDVDVPDLVDGRPAAASRSTGGRSFLPLVAAAALVTVLTVGAFLLVRRPADDVVVSEPSGTPAPATIDTTIPSSEPTPSAAPAPLPDPPPLSVTALEPVPTLVSDREPRPITPFERVAAGAMFVEPDFGTTITRLTASGPGTVTAPAASTAQVFNADSTLALLYRTGVASPGHIVFDVATGEIVDTPDLSAATDIEDIAWDATNPNVLRFVDSARTLVIEHDVRGDIVADVLPGECESTDFGDRAGSVAGRSATFAYVCDTTEGADWISYDTTTRREVARRPAIPNADGSVHAPLTMASGNGFVMIDDHQVVVLGPRFEPTGVVVDIETSAVTLALDSEGRDVLAATVFDDADGELIGTAVEVDLATGAQRVITGQATGYPYPPTGTTIGIVGGENSTLVAIATSPEAREPDTLDDEVLLIDLEADTTFRLAHHRMGDADDFENWSTPFVAVSPDGSTVLFSSNFGGDSVDTYLISLPG